MSSFLIWPEYVFSKHGKNGVKVKDNLQIMQQEYGVFNNAIRHKRRDFTVIWIWLQGIWLMGECEAVILLNWMIKTNNV